MDENLLGSAMQVQDAIISTLGPNGPGNKTWNDVYHSTFPSIVSLLFRVMLECWVRRIFALAKIGIYDDRDRRSALHAVLTAVGWVIGMPVHREFVEIGKTFQTEGQDLEWTVFRIGSITDAEESNAKAGLVRERDSRLNISRKVTVSWLLELVEASPQCWIKWHLST